VLPIRGGLAAGALLAVAGAGLAGCAPAQPTAACAPIDEAGVHRLFDEWDAALQTGDPHVVVARYAEGSILLPTLSGTPRLTPESKIDYFEHFLENEPSGAIDDDVVSIGCDFAIDTGNYTFTFGTTSERVPARFTFVYEWDPRAGEWLIASHHSSATPEG